MSFTALRLANFKAFGAVQRLPLKPITLVFGANSAGKSSFIHALALAHHAVETGDLDTQRTQIGGEAIDLGGFRQYVHRRDRHRQMELAFEIDTGQLSGRIAQLLHFTRRVTTELAIGAGFAGDQLTLFRGFTREIDREGSVRVERLAIEVDGAPLLAMSARPGGLLRLDRLEHQHPAFRELLRGILTLATTTERIRDEDFAELATVIDALVPSITARRRGLVPRIEDEAETTLVEAPPELLPVSRGRRQEDLSRAARLFLPGVLRDLVGGLAEAVETEVRRLRYLGPLRSYPPRHLAFAQHQDPNWFAGGGYAWDVVRTREDIRRQVNRWLGDAGRLKTPYELVVRELLPAVAISNELPPKIAKALHDLAGDMLAKLQGDEQANLVSLAAEVAEKLADLDPEDVGDTLPEIEELVAAATDSEALAERWAEELVEERSEAIQDLVLIDKRTGTPVSHRDVGIGVSQVLPVLVSAFAFRDQLVAIEQPEIHLHPALQAELGDVFLTSALGEQRNTFLIETHSEHLILRILRRIRETTEGELPDGAPAVRADDIAVLYVQPGAHGAEVVHIPVTEDGEFAQPWPEGFFPERAKELF
jgi:predicted ATPase